MNGREPDAALKRQVMDFASRASIEVTTHDRDTLASLPGHLPAGTVVYVPHTPHATLAEVVDVACEIESLGFGACPHLVARRIEGDHELAAALDRLKSRRISRALVVAGDLAQPVGGLASSLELLDSGALEAAGIDRIGVAGFPEGHGLIEADRLWTALRRKQDYAERTGARVHIVSQFGFDAGVLAAWDSELDAHGIALPVHAGIAGPASLGTLIRFARLCGIGASLGALTAKSGAVALAMGRSAAANRMLFRISGLMAGALTRHIVQPHVFSFGGALDTVRWLEALRTGRFDVNATAAALVMRS